jgi:hypothetical protein
LRTRDLSRNESHIQKSVGYLFIGKTNGKTNGQKKYDFIEKHIFIGKNQKIDDNFYIHIISN